MIAGHVAIALRVKPDVAGQFVGMELPAGNYIGRHEGLERHATLVGNNGGHNVSAALEGADNDRLARAAAHMFAALDAADQSFVNLDRRPRPAYKLVAVICSRISEAMRHAVL